MKTPITIAVLALHVAIITTILVQQGCNSTEDASTVNPDLASTPAEVKAETIAKPALPEGSADLRADPTRPAEPVVASANEIKPEPVKESVVSEPVKAEEKIVLPDTKEVAPVLAPDPDPAEKAPTTYIVQKGDSLSKIASQNGVSLEALMLQNNLNKNSIIKIGQKLDIPNGSNVVEKAKESAPQEVSSGEAKIYVVQKGDSLSKIAVKNKTTIRAIMDANGMKKTTVKLGQKLKIPSAAETKKVSAEVKAKDLAKKYEGKQIHVVAKGEYLGGIAAKYKMPVIELMDKNSIVDPRKVQVGQVLIIKDLAPAKVQEEKSVAPTTEASKTEAPVVAPLATPSVQEVAPATTQDLQAPATSNEAPKTENTQDL